MPIKNGQAGDNSPITISHFRENSRPLTVKWLGQDISVSYRPGMLDSGHYAQVREDEDLPMSEWYIKYGLRVFAAIPTFCEPDGSPLEITEENLRLLPTPMLSEIVKAIGRDLDPNANAAN